MTRKLAYAVAIAAAVATWAFIFASAKACERDGGHFVRGVFWYECIKPTSR